MIKVIQSKDNRIFKACQKLQQKKYRDREGLYLIEGPNLIGEAPAADIEYIVISVRAAVRLRRIPVGRSAGLSDGRAAVSTHCADGDKQGIAAAVKRRSWSWSSCPSCAGPGKIWSFWTGSGSGQHRNHHSDSRRSGLFRRCRGRKGTADIFSPKTIRAARRNCL